MISIILPTHNRRDSLRLTLESLTGLNYPDYEVIVADDGSTDRTQEVVEEFKVGYYRQERKGISAAKNLGISKARGEILVFTDDDCRAEPDWLSKLTSCLTKEEVGAVGGPDMAHHDDPFLAKCVDYAVTSFIGTGGVRRKGKRIGRYYPRSFNMLVPRKVIEQVGRFDEGLGAGEDIDLSLRIKKAGYSLRYAKDAFVWHRRRDTIIGFIRQIFIRGCTRVTLIRKHKELLEPAYLIPPFLVLLVPALLLLSLVSPIILIIPAILCSAILLTSGVHASLKIRDIRALPVVPLLLFLQHITYGIGFFRALFTINLDQLSNLSIEN